MANIGMRVLIHASAFFAPYLVPIVFFIVSLFMDDYEVKKTAVQAVLWQLMIGILLSISYAFSFILIGIPFLIGFGIMWIVVPILGILKTLKGESYNYPVVGRFFR